ncbi:MAG TPA: AraC family transcriptional regulator [Firmicutes bacterium]|nr:AraC family transcriptional regulator [Bacillota bacterium]
MMQIVTDETKKELRQHGTDDFPFEYYYDVIDEYDIKYIDWHWHPEVEFVYVEDNTVLCLIDGQKITLSKNEGIFINCNTLHRYESVNGGVIPNFLFMPEFIASKETAIFKKYVDPIIHSTTPFFVIKDTETVDLMKKLKEVCVSNEETRELKIHKFSEELWESLYKNASQAFQEGKNHLSRNLAGYRTQTMMRFIHENYSKGIKLEDIAASSSVSKSEALRCFHTSLNTTPIDYLIHYRLNAAAQMLKTRNTKISTVAELTGFENISYFCRMFRRKYGLSPMQYRIKNMQ